MLPSDPHHLLVVRLSALGDVLLCLPALERLRQARPQLRITFLTSPALGPLLRRSAVIDEVLAWPLDGGGKAQAARLLAPSLSAIDFDVYVDLQHKLRTIMLGRHLKLPTLAHPGRSFGQALRSLFGRERPSEAPHASQRVLQLLKPLVFERSGVGDEEALRCTLRQDSQGRVISGETKDRALQARPRVGLCAFSRWGTKALPTAKAKALAEGLRRRGLQLVWIGGPLEQAAIEGLRAKSPVRATPKEESSCSLGLEALADCLASLDLLVSIDSGPGHLAAALGVPVLSLFGPTSAARWAPTSMRGRVLDSGQPCAPCSNHGTLACPLGTHVCMEALDLQRVFAAVDQMLNRSPTSSPELPPK